MGNVNTAPVRTMGAFLYLFIENFEKEMQKMYQRTLKQLVSEKEKVWVYLDSEEVCRCFFEQANAEGFCFGNLPYSEWVTDSLIAVHSDGQMGHPPYFVRMKLRSENTDIVDYRKYSENSGDIYYSFAERNDDNEK